LRAADQLGVFFPTDLNDKGQLYRNLQIILPLPDRIHEKQVLAWQDGEQVWGDCTSSNRW